MRYTALRPEVSRQRGLAEPADIATHTRVADPNEPFQFSFPHLQARLISAGGERVR